MFTTRIRLVSPFLAFTLLVAVLWSGSHFVPGTDAADANESKLKQLLNEKLQVLKSIVAQKEELHKLREVGIRELFEAHVAMHRAQFDLCDSDQERIAVLEVLLGEARRHETMLLDLPKQSVPGLPEGAHSINAKQAKVNCLDIEIEIERIKSKK